MTDEVIGADNSPASMRRQYSEPGLAEADLAAGWWEQFGRWFADAVRSGQLVEPNAMVLATASPDGRPSTRTVLLKEYDQRGFVFFTNYLSRKGREMAANPVVSVVFPWIPLQRQVVICGTVERIERSESEAYFASRPRGSQLGAWASAQSTVVGSRAVLEHALAEAVERWPGAAPVPTPEHWGGLLVRPRTVEFWQGQPDRLHDRLQYRRVDPDGDGPAGWTVERLSP